jgi:ADP-heptose:LPS heptosyltransferase
MILISPYSKKLRTGKTNPKNYPFWQILVGLVMANGRKIVQVGIEGEEPLVPDFRKNLSLPELRKLVRECDTWISCDSFLQHLGWDEKKEGIVLWGCSDPLIFGHSENVNLLKDRKYLAPNQFGWWEFVEHNPESFVDPQLVANAVEHLLSFDKTLKIASNTR